MWQTPRWKHVTGGIGLRSRDVIVSLISRIPQVGKPHVIYFFVAYDSLLSYSTIVHIKTYIFMFLVKTMK